MYEEFNPENVDTSQFIALRLEDQSLYYGQVSYRQQGSFEPLSPSNPKLQDLIKDAQVEKIKQGIGYWKSTNSQDKITEIKGNWTIDEPDGLVLLKFSDGTLFNGRINKGKRNGYGVCHWGGKECYRGFWKDDMMHGVGVFVSKDIKYEGNFIKGYFIENDGRAINPFLPEANPRIMKVSTRLEREDRINERFFRFIKSANVSDLECFLIESYAKDRIALFLSSHRRSISFQELQALSMTNFNCNLNVYEALYLKEHHYDKFTQLMNQFYTDFRISLKEGGIVCLNIEEQPTLLCSENKDMRTLSDKGLFPSLIFSPKELKNPMILSRLFPNESFNVSRNFGIVLISDYKIDERNPALIRHDLRGKFGMIVKEQILDLFLLD